MTGCEKYAPMIGSFEGELTPEEARALEGHLATCERCRAIAADLAATEGLVSEALLARAATRDFAPFVDQVMARVAPPQRTSVLDWLLGHRRVLAGVLVPGLAAAALFVYVSRSGGRPEIALLEVAAEGEAVTVIQTSEGPIVLLSSEENT